MKCYICEKEAYVGGTRYAIAEAVGICHDCGIAVCLDHSRKAKEPGSPLLCPVCASGCTEQSVSHLKPKIPQHQN